MSDVNDGRPPVPEGYGWQNQTSQEGTSSYQGPGDQGSTSWVAQSQPTQSQPTQSQPTQSQPTQSQPTQGFQTSQTSPVPPRPVAPQPAASQPQEPRHEHPARHIPVFVSVLLGVLFGAGIVLGVLRLTGVIGTKTSTTSSSGSSSTIAQNVTISASTTSASLAQAVAAKDLSSVVSVSVTTTSGSGVGSGVIIDTGGDIITNYHVISGAQTITVSVNGKSYDATVVGSDSSSDLAVIKASLDGDSVTPIEVGDSSALTIGEWVMTIGSPFGLDQSVSEGIVSSLNRSTTMTSSTSGNLVYANLIQTDAAINPGNSGGALVNSQGQLVGITALFASESGSSSSVGFAIDGNYAMKVAKQIISGQKVVHAYLGVGTVTVTASNAASNNLSVTQGAYVGSVTSGSAADKAGIQKGDIITAVGGTQISTSSAVTLAVRSHDVGDTIQITLMRGTQEMTVSVTLGSDEGVSTSTSTTTNGYGSTRSYGTGTGGTTTTGSYTGSSYVTNEEGTSTLVSAATEQVDEGVEAAA